MWLRGRCPGTWPDSGVTGVIQSLTFTIITYPVPVSIQWPLNYRTTSKRPLGPAVVIPIKCDKRFHPGPDAIIFHFSWARYISEQKNWKASSELLYWKHQWEKLKDLYIVTKCNINRRQEICFFAMKSIVTQHTCACSLYLSKQTYCLCLLFMEQTETNLECYLCEI